MSERFFTGWFLFVALLSVVMLGLMVWAVVKLVNWLTGLEL